MANPTSPHFSGIRVLAIDLIGTLVEKAGQRFYELGSEFLAKNGHQVSPRRFKKVFRERYLEYSMGNYENDRQFYLTFLADLSDTTRSPCFEELTDIRMRCHRAFDDAATFLQQASTTHRLILSTNHVSDWTRRILIANRWERYFQALIVSSDCRSRKPSPQFFREVLKASGVTSLSEILVVGDSLVNDVYGATSVGLQAVLLDRKGAACERQYLKAALVISSLDDLMDFLTGRRNTTAQFLGRRGAW